MSSNEYTLDFVIPAGPTGPVGPSGVSSLCYVQFADSTSTGNMLIGTSTILPITSTDYIVSPNTIQINSPGYYEIVFCGKINRNTANKQIDVHVIMEELLQKCLVCMDSGQMDLKLFIFLKQVFSILKIQ